MPTAYGEHEGRLQAAIQHAASLEEPNYAQIAQEYNVTLPSPCLHAEGVSPPSYTNRPHNSRA